MAKNWFEKLKAFELFKHCVHISAMKVVWLLLPGIDGMPARCLASTALEW